jgi:hypothetical protein
MKEEGRGKRDEGRGKKDEERGKKEGVLLLQEAMREGGERRWMPILKQIFWKAVRQDKGKSGERRGKEPYI